MRLIATNWCWCGGWRRHLRDFVARRGAGGTPELNSFPCHTIFLKKGRCIHSRMQHRIFIMFTHSRHHYHLKIKHSLVCATFQNPFRLRILLPPHVYLLIAPLLPSSYVQTRIPPRLLESNHFTLCLPCEKYYWLVNFSTSQWSYQYSLSLFGKS